MPQEHLICARHLYWMAALLCAVAVGAGCTTRSTDRGIENTWREIPETEWQPGVTDQGDVLEKLGPPSQVIALGDESVFYYLLEVTKSRKLTLFIYNRERSRTTYDRAVFFFNEEDILTKHSLSRGPEAE